MDKQNTNQRVKSCKIHCAIQGLCKYWNRRICNNSTCKYLHTCIASIQPLKITRHEEITLIISKQVTLSPSEAAIFINENYKNSEMGIPILLDKKQNAANLKKIVRGNAQDKMKHKEEVEKMLLQLKGKKQQGIINKNKIQITKLEQNTTKESRSETKIEQSNQSIFLPNKLSMQQISQNINKQKYDSEKMQIQQINLNNINQLNKLNNQNTSQEEKQTQKQIVSKIKGILKNNNLNISSNSSNRSTSKRQTSPIQTENPSLSSISMDSKKSDSSSSQLYYDESPKNENLKIPPKKKSNLFTDQYSLKATTKQSTSQLEKIGKKEEDHQKDILSLQNQVVEVGIGSKPNQKGI